MLDLIKIMNFSTIKFNYFKILIFIFFSLNLTSCHNTEQTQIKTLEKPSINLTQTPQSQPLTIKDRQPFVIKIKRSTKEMTIFDRHNVAMMKTPIGIGRGGLKTKTDMIDLVTPIGTMKVDLILYKDENFNQVAPEMKAKYLSSGFKDFFTNQAGLKQLFQNMNRIDFNSDGQPDQSYGIAYIGLTSATDQKIVTGPKMRYANWQSGKNIPYWFSIALHGTSTEEKDLGSANSGGCIHVSRKVLTEIIETGIIQIDTQVIITD